MAEAPLPHPRLCPTGRSRPLPAQISRQPPAPERKIMSSNTVQETHGSRGFLIISITRVSKMVIKTIREQQRRHARQKMCQTTLLDCIKTQLFSALLRENTFRWLKCSTGCKSGSSGASGTGASLALLAFGKATAFSTLSPAAAADARAFLAGTAFGVGLDSSATAAAAVLRRRAAAVCKMHELFAIVAVTTVATADFV